MNHFTDIHPQSTATLTRILKVARQLRDEWQSERRHAPLLAHRTLALLFEKPSLRTRVSFEQAMYQLGGQAITLHDQEIGLGKRESVADVVRVLSGMVDAIAARVFHHHDLIEMTEYGTIPVINALSDQSHPCQALADIMTMQDHFGLDLAGRTLTFVGDGNNVARSLARLCGKLQINFILAAPEGYQFQADQLGELQADSAQFQVTHDPIAAVKQADAIYADTFVSMGEESQKEAKIKIFQDYQINEQLLTHAPSEAIVLHCLPAYRGIEITDQVMDGPQSHVFAQAHNRLHAQKGLLAVLLADQK